MVKDYRRGREIVAVIGVWIWRLKVKIGWPRVVNEDHVDDLVARR